MDTFPTHDLKFKINGFAYPGSIVDPIVEETTLTAGSSTGVSIYDGYAEIIVEAKDASGGDHSVYVIDYSTWS